MMAATLSVASIGAAQTEGSRDLSRAYAQRLLDETDSQTSALQAGQTPLEVGGHFKLRYQVNSRNDVPGGDDVTIGFELPDTRVEARGRVERFDYNINADFFPDGSIRLQDAWWRWDFENGWTFTAGQFKFGYLREELVDDTGLLGSNRSITANAFTQARSQGVEARYTEEDYRLAIGVSDGLRTFNTDFLASAEADFGVNVRGEWKFAGNDWDRFNDFASFQGSDYTGMVGGAVWYQDGGNTTGTFAANVVGLTTDVTVESNGWSAFASVIYQQFDPDTGQRQDDFGATAQAAYFLTPQWEIFGRWDSIFADVQSDFTTLTFGANYYIIEGSQTLKFTSDVQIYLDEQSTSPAQASSVINLLPSANESQVGVTFQLQLVF
jgi:phosphate-selective porin